MPIIIETLAELPSLVGCDLGTSKWHEITQEQVDLFADATGDRQWIHVDPARAAAESPFGGTIAHGYLTVSLLGVLLGDILVTDNMSMAINYGINRVRFPAPLPVGSRVRLAATMHSVEAIDGGAQIVVALTVECDRAHKPVCVAEAVYRYYD
ncbi:MaoC family dehydratase [Nocardia beijingensis]|uniref:MaoC family dehydratase n=1 Tax=Nocardia beijingensis TaxID=95162 RepID=UPI0033C40943